MTRKSLSRPEHGLHLPLTGDDRADGIGVGDRQVGEPFQDVERGAPVVRAALPDDQGALYSGSLQDAAEPADDGQPCVVPQAGDRLRHDRLAGDEPVPGRP